MPDALEHAVIINCPWGAAKNSGVMMSVLASIVDGVCEHHVQLGTAMRVLQFQLLTGLADDRYSLYAIREYVMNYITAHAPCLQQVIYGGAVVVSVVGKLPITQFLKVTAAAHLTLDAIPFR